MKTLHFGLLIIICFAFSCKDSSTKPVKTNDPAATTNKTELFEDAGLADKSGMLEARQNEIWPEVPSFVHFRSNGIVRAYLNTVRKDSVDFTQNDLVSIIGRKVGHGVDFVVDSLDVKSSPAKLVLRTVKNDKVKNEHRPSFVFSIPKKYAATTPTIILDSKLVGGMVID